MQKNSEFITHKKHVFEYLDHSDDKSNVIGSLLSHQTFKFKPVSIYENTILMKAIENNLKITKEFLEVSGDLNYENGSRLQTALSLALENNYSVD